MLRKNSSLFFGVLTLLYCSNINAMDYKFNTSAFDNDLNINFLSSDYLMNNESGDNFNDTLRSTSKTTVKYSTKCRGKDNPYNNHLLLERIDTKQPLRKKLKSKTIKHI